MRKITIVFDYGHADVLCHYGVKGMKWGVRRTPEQLGHKVSKKLDDIPIHKGVGAKSKNYDVEDKKSGEIFHFVEGSKIRDVEVFAGKGSKQKLQEEVALGLSEQLGGNPNEWQHCKGKGILDYHGEERSAEVHWFQEKTVGKHKFKVKKWLD